MKNLTIVLIVALFCFRTYLQAQCNLTVNTVPNQKISCGDSVILKTIATSWQKIEIGYTDSLYSVWFTDSVTGYVVGENGNIFKGHL